MLICAIAMATFYRVDGMQLDTMSLIVKMMATRIEENAQHLLSCVLLGLLCIYAIWHQINSYLAMKPMKKMINVLQA
jgi:hypothetical protein